MDILGWHCHAIRIWFENHLVDKVKKLRCYKRLIKNKLLQSLSLCVFLNLRYSSKYFSQIYRAHYGAAMLVFISGIPTWRPEKENSVNIIERTLAILLTDYLYWKNKLFSIHYCTFETTSGFNIQIIMNTF